MLPLYFSIWGKVKQVNGLQSICMELLWGSASCDSRWWILYCFASKCPATVVLLLLLLWWILIPSKNHWYRIKESRAVTKAQIKLTLLNSIILIQVGSIAADLCLSGGCKSQRFAQSSVDQSGQQSCVFLGKRASTGTHLAIRSASLEVIFSTCTCVLPVTMCYLMCDPLVPLRWMVLRSRDNGILRWHTTVLVSGSRCLFF